MRCPYCQHLEDKVIDSRETQEGRLIRRRRECLKCGRRFTTYENIEEISFMVIKKDGRREPFDRNKILNGLVKACQKRPISIEKLENIVNEIERNLYSKFDKEVETKIIGEMVMEKLANLDDVAYIRFASVYREFTDTNQFLRMLREILSRKAK